MSLLIWDEEFASAVSVTKEDERILLWDEHSFDTAEEFHDWFHDTFVFWGVVDIADLDLVERWLGLDE